IHPTPSDHTRPSCGSIWPKTSTLGQARRLALAFPEHAGWDWRPADATRRSATATYLDELLGRHVIEAPEPLSHQLLSELTLDQPTSQLRSPALDPASLSSSEGIS